MPVVVFEDREPSAVEPASDRDGLWLSPADLLRVTGWEVKPEGVCRGDVCVALPPGRERDGGSSVDLLALARLLGQPVVYEAEADVWAFGHAPRPEPAPGTPLEAPDFRLPDLQGRPHALSDYRGAKVLLLSWASW